MNMTKEEKQRIKHLHNQQFLLKEEKERSLNLQEGALGGMASVGSGFANKQGDSGRLGKFINQNSEEDPMEENLAGYYDFGEVELEESTIVYEDEDWFVVDKEDEEGDDKEDEEVDDKED